MVEPVSQDLRDGVRRSVELVATEIVNRRRAHGLPVEGVPNLAYKLTRQSLRFLYRILFPLYAEARPELGVLPVDAPEYVGGHGLSSSQQRVSLTRGFGSKHIVYVRPRDVEIAV